MGVMIPLPKLHSAGAARNFQARLLRSINLTLDTKHLEWDIVGDGLEFLPGQFVSAIIPCNGHTELRPYSVASPPRGDNRFELCINRVKGGYASNYFCDLVPGATVHFKGPYGCFVLAQPIECDLVFLATGTGIAPFRSMLLDAFARDPTPDRDMWLIFGVRYVDAILYRTDFGSLERAHPHFHFVPVVSRPSADWTGAVGHVQDELRRRFAGRTDFQAYLCGLKAMVEETRVVLTAEFGLKRGRILFEEFV